MSYYVKLSGEYLSCYWNKIGSVGSRKFAYYHYIRPTKKWCHNSKHFSISSSIYSAP